MKLRVPDDNTGEIRDSKGVQYTPVNGIVEIPDDCVHGNLWSRGFTRVADLPPASRYAASSDAVD